MRFPLRACFLSLLTIGSVACCIAACETTTGLADPNDTPRKDGGKDSSSGSSGTEDDDSSIPGGDSGGPVVEGDRCDPIKPFGEPELQSDLDGAVTTKSAVMSADELEIFYLRKASPFELRHGRRANHDAPWEIFTDAISPTPTAALSLTANGLKLYFWNFDAGISKNLFATRSARTQNFSTPAQTLINYASSHMFIVNSDDSAWFGQFQDGGSDQIIVRGNVINNGVTSPTIVPNLHGIQKTLDTNAVLNATETTIYLSSTSRPDTLGAADIYVSRRPSKQATFGAPSHVVELSSTGPDYVTWVSNDDCVVLLDRSSHIYLARRPK